MKIVTLELLKQIKLSYHKDLWFVAVQFVYFFLSQFFLIPLHITTQLNFNFGLTPDIKMPVLASKVRLNGFLPFMTILRKYNSFRTWKEPPFPTTVSIFLKKPLNFTLSFWRVANHVVMLAEQSVRLRGTICRVCTRENTRAQFSHWPKIHHDTSSSGR